MKNYAQWNQERFFWKNKDEFLRDDVIRNGIHTIVTAAGVEIDFYVKNGPIFRGGKAPIVIFSGAISKRSDREGPFFSGLGIASRLDTTVIAVADPGIDASPDLGIAWYTGGPRQHTQREIASILNGISLKIGNEILLAGGSAGGFAALTFGSMLGKNCSVFVWNPQTDILAYRERFVRAYLRRTFRFSLVSLTERRWKDQTKRRLDHHITHNVLAAEFAQNPSRLFYMQNISDEHASLHLKPFLKKNAFSTLDSNISTIDADHVCVLADFADGHTPPPAQVLQEIMQSMIDREKSAVWIAKNIALKGLGA